MTGDTGSDGTPDAPELTVRFAVLARIAAGLCRDAGVSRVELAQRDVWSWTPSTRVLKVGRRSFTTLGIEGCAGVIAHEVGHAFISRYHLLVGSARGATRVARWLNAVEDPRVEAYMVRRYPGVARWLERAHLLLLAEWKPEGLPPLRHHQWCLGAAIDDNPAGSALAEHLLPEVKEALSRTHAARRRYRDGFLPGDEAGGYPDPAVEHGELCVTHGLDPDVSPREQVVQTLAIQAWAYFRRFVAPAVDELFEADVDEVAGLIVRNSALREKLKQATTRMPTFVTRLRLARGRAANRPMVLDDEARLLARLWLDHTNAESGPAPWLGGDGQLLASADGVPEGSRRGPRPEHRTAAPERTELPPRASGEPRRRPAPDGDPAVVRSSEPAPPSRLALIDRLERILRDELRQRRCTVGREYAHTGVRPDLRRVMTNEGPFAGDPSRWRPAWHRAAPIRPDAAFCLLIDCSGSMRGAKIVAAIQAGQVFAQAITRVGAPFFVAGFQDELIPLARVGGTARDAETAIAEAALEVRGRRPGGHNQPSHNDDGPCILEAVARLNTIPATQRVLVVLTDGQPHGRRSGPAELSDAIAKVQRDGIDVVGVGIGPGATHVREYYPRAVVVERAERLAEAMVGVLGRWRQG